MSTPFLIAKGQDEIFFDPKMANRHGLIAGATGTGNTITLQGLAENLSAIGVPVFAEDVPVGDGEAGEFETVETELFDALVDLWI